MAGKPRLGGFSLGFEIGRIVGSLIDLGPINYEIGVDIGGCCSPAHILPASPSDHRGEMVALEVELAENIVDLEVGLRAEPVVFGAHGLSARIEDLDEERLFDGGRRIDDTEVRTEVAGGLEIEDSPFRFDKHAVLIPGNRRDALAIGPVPSGGRGPGP